MKKVLITLDFDSTAQKVAAQGYALAKEMKAEVILLHVIADSSYYSSLIITPMSEFGGFGSADFIHKMNTDGVTNAAQIFLDKIKKHLDDKAIKTQVESGDIAEVVLKTAKHVHADIIVMGSHSRRWLEQIVMGSVTEKVLHHTTIPLFIIPTKKQNS